MKNPVWERIMRDTTWLGVLRMEAGNADRDGVPTDGLTDAQLEDILRRRIHARSGLPPR